MDQELTPGEIAARRFRQALRGFDPAEVSAFLAEVAGQVEGLISQRDRLAGRLGEYADRDLKSEFDAVGSEVATVLEAARTAAEGMRERATTDAARWRGEALAEAEAERRAARADAEHLRSDAWTTSEELLRQAQAEARRLQETAERDSLSVLGEAEREAHRLTSGGRREAEDLLRTARMEAEKLNAEARSRHDEIIEQARRQAEASQERARALEQRRQELIGELETLRATLSRMEGELDERRSRLGLSPASEAIEDERIPLRVVRPDELESHQPSWEPGETVRVIPSRRKPDASSFGSGEDLVAEVRRLRQEETATPSSVPDQAEAPVSEPAPPPEEVPVPEVPEQVEEAAPVEDEKEEEVPEAISFARIEEAAPSLDEVGDIFRRLRGEPLPYLAASPPAPEPEPEPEPVPAQAPRPQQVITADPFEYRERLLLPVTNRVLRNVKRQLTELQNLALEELRTSGGSWRPQEPSFVDQLRPDLVVLMAEAFSMGHSAAEEMLGRSLTRPATPAREESTGIARSLLEQLSSVMESTGEDGPRELAGSVSRVFRGWRTDEAERRISDLAASAYHQGMRASLGPEGVQANLVVFGRGCVRCREAAEGEDDVTPPLHSGCGCTLVPIAD
jgi:DivIVA domain-containing protein